MTTETTKELHELTINELVKWGIELELDAIVRGESLKSRVYAVMSLAAQWESQRRDAAEKVK